jgi:hypothetical protein
MAIILRFVTKDGFIREHFFDIIHVIDTLTLTLNDSISFFFFFFFSKWL